MVEAHSPLAFRSEWTDGTSDLDSFGVVRILAVASISTDVVTISPLNHPGLQILLPLAMAITVEIVHSFQPCICQSTGS